MNDISLSFSIPYMRPTVLSNPYGEYSKADIGEILNMAPEFLQQKHFKSIFRPVSIASYDEACFYLPYAFNYILSHPESSHETLKTLAFWGVTYYELLYHDNIWNDMDNTFFSLFAMYTKVFILQDGEPQNMEIISLYNDYFQQEWGHSTVTDKTIPSLHYHLDKYLERRFENPCSYPDWAWIIYLIDQVNLRYLKSDYLTQTKILRKEWHGKALDAIIHEMLIHEEIEPYWTRLLDQNMIF